jgi:hypothetical protein
MAFFVVAMIAIFFANGVSNAVKRLVWNRSGKSFRPLSRQLVREYSAACRPDRNYWAYCFSLLVLFLGMAGFVFLPLFSR